MRLQRFLSLLQLVILVPAFAAEVPVSTAGELAAAVSAAAPGDVITLAPGTYDFSGNLHCTNAGTAEAPITVQAAALGDALLRFDGSSSVAEGFVVEAPHWIFENLDIQGTCTSHSDCEHAFHIVGNADFTEVRRCRLHDFNAMIKGNGLPLGVDGSYVFADDVVIEFNEFFDATARDTSNPVTPIDVVGGRRWVVRGNLIADFQKGQSDYISYAAFLKGNSRDGLFERNLVICERNHTGGIRLGLSFGGGGSGPPIICEDGTCTPEHQNGTMRNNIVVNCPQDVCIYLNEATGTRILHNTLVNCTGVDVRFAASTADLRNNLMSGDISERDGGSATKAGNLENISLASWQAWFADPLAADFSLVDGTSIVDQGVVPVAVDDDFCANLREDGAPDRGAVEYDGTPTCDTSVGGGGVIGPIFRDGFESGTTAAWSSSAGG